MWQSSSIHLPRAPELWRYVGFLLRPSSPPHPLPQILPSTYDGHRRPRAKAIAMYVVLGASRDLLVLNITFAPSHSHEVRVEEAGGL